MTAAQYTYSFRQCTAIQEQITYVDLNILNSEQEAAQLYINGEAGTGKSFYSNCYINIRCRTILVLIPMCWWLHLQWLLHIMSRVGHFTNSYIYMFETKVMIFTINFLIKYYNRYENSSAMF